MRWPGYFVYFDVPDSVYNFNHLERYTDNGFIILPGLQHVFVVFLIIPVDHYIVLGLVDGLKFLENIQDALGGTGVKVLQVNVHLGLCMRVFGIIIKPVNQGFVKLD